MKYVSVIDIGSSKIVCATVSSDNDGAIVVHGIGICEYSGYRLGKIPSISTLSEALQTAIELSEKESGIRVRDVCIGVPAPFIKTVVVPVRIESEVHNARISSNDIDYLINLSGVSSPPMGYELMHSTPFSFIIDDVEPVESPIGRQAHSLSAKVSHVFVDAKFRSLVSDCLKEIGVSADPFISSLVAESLFVIPFEQRKEGTVLIDCGGSHCDVSLIKEDALLESMSIGIGGNHFASDIAFCLRLPMTCAEELKRKYNFNDKRKDYIDRIWIPNEGMIAIRGSDIKNIIEARMDELGDYIFEILCEFSSAFTADFSTERASRAPAYLTGSGVVELQGGVDYLADCIGREIIVNTPIMGRMNSAGFATSFALAQFMLYGSGISVRTPNRLIKSIKEFILTKL